MAGYQTIEALRPILHKGPPPTPVVDLALVRPEQAKREQAQAARRGFFVTAPTSKRMRELRSLGWTLHEIASEVGHSHRTVQIHTKGIKPPKGGWKKGGCAPKFDVAEACRLRRAGLTYKAIGEALGCSESCAHHMARGRNGKTRGPNPQVTVRVQAVAKISGFSTASLRTKKGSYSKKGSAQLSKARALLFWSLATCDGMRHAAIGRELGGFHGTTVTDGVRRVDLAAAQLGLLIPKFPAHLMSPLWAAEWPKASA